MLGGPVNQQTGRRATTHGGKGFRIEGDFSKKVKVKKSEDVAAQRASDVSLQRRLTYGRWPIGPFVFRVLQYLIAFGSACLAYQIVGVVLQGLAFVGGKLLLDKLLARSIERRSNLFDRDYPQFLLSVVALLKTGMNPIQALQAAAENFDERSLLRFEVELMIERMKYGVSEDASVGAFAKEILHPEVELFVQALLLSRRVGGQLSETLERLARQVRKRQEFRAQAKASVAQQRGSVFVIVGIMIGLFGLLVNKLPNLISALQESPGAQMGLQVGVGVICLAIVWVNKITKIRA